MALRLQSPQGSGWVTHTGQGRAEQSTEDAPLTTDDDTQNFFKSKIEIAEHTINRKTQNLRRLEAQRNNLNARVRLLREELQLLQEPGSYVGEVVKIMGKTKVLVKTGQEGKYIVDFSNDIKLEDLRPNLRVALRSDCACWAQWPR